MNRIRAQLSTSTGKSAWLARGALAWLLLAGAMVHAADPVPVFREGTSGDAVCTVCHGADEKKPILSVHQTRHGVAGQPGCQACHGSSRAHVQHGDTAGARPPADFVFGGPNRSSAEVQSRTCLNCHSGKPNIHWNASAHPANGVTCASCRAIHRPRDPALSRASQADVCFACHQRQRAREHYLSAHSMANGSVACGDCHDPHGSAGPSLLRGNTVNDTCFSCHADYRLPGARVVRLGWEREGVRRTFTEVERTAENTYRAELRQGGTGPWTATGGYARQVRLEAAPRRLSALGLWRGGCGRLVRRSRHRLCAGRRRQRHGVLWPR